MKKYNTKFLSNKYALIYFIRRKRDSGKDLLFIINIRGLRVEVKKIKLEIFNRYKNNIKETYISGNKEK